MSPLAIDCHAAVEMESFFLGSDSFFVKNPMINNSSTLYYYVCACGCSML